MVTFIFVITQILTVFKPTPIDTNQCLCPFNHNLRNKWAWGCPLPLSYLYVVLKAVKQQTLKVVYDYFINIKYIANTQKIIYQGRTSLVDPLQFPYQTPTGNCDHWCNTLTNIQVFGKVLLSFIIESI